MVHVNYRFAPEPLASPRPIAHVRELFDGLRGHGRRPGRGRAPGPRRAARAGSSSRAVGGRGRAQVRLDGCRALLARWAFPPSTTAPATRSRPTPTTSASPCTRSPPASEGLRRWLSALRVSAVLTGRSRSAAAPQLRLVPWWASVLVVFVLTRVVTTVIMLQFAANQQANSWTGRVPPTSTSRPCGTAAGTRSSRPPAIRASCPSPTAGDVGENAWAFMPRLPGRRARC